MQTRNFAILAGTLGLGLAMLIPMQAQGPLYDRVQVTLPYTVTLGDTTLQPGDYTIREVPSQNKSDVLAFYGNNGMKFETTAMAIPAYDPNTPDKSELTLHHIGDNYYFDKIWIQGKNYGYQIPLPSSVKARENEQSAAIHVPATYQPAPQQTAQATPPPAPAPAPAPEAAPAPAPAPQPEIAQNTTPAPEPSTPPSASANRQELPQTSAGWLFMLLSGGSLSGAGFLLRRRS